MKCERCGRTFFFTSAIRSQLKHGTVETWCRGCGFPIMVTPEMMEKDDKERIENSTKCTCCGKEKEADGYLTCPSCREFSRIHTQESRESIKKIVGWSTKKKPKESVDDIARKARSHGLSYGKYLEARARGMYLSEVEE